MKITLYTEKISKEIFDLLLIADPNIDAINEYVKNSLIMAVHDGKAIIGVGVMIENDDIHEIKNIAVQEEYQRKGIGKELIKELVRTASTKGSTIVEVGTGNSSILQLAFYQKCGFRFDRIVKGFFDSYPDDIYENGIKCRDMIYLRIEI